MRMLVLALVLCALVAAPASLAHNAGHVITGSGECRDVGSNKEAPQVPESNPNRNDLGQLDLIDGPAPDTRDQFGARFAAEQGQSRVRPGTCPA